MIRSVMGIIRRAPFATLLGLFSVAVVVAALATARHPGSVGPNPDPARPTMIYVGNGELVVQWWVDRPFQDAHDDRWSFGLDWLHLGIWYTGTYKRPGSINIHGVYYQTCAPLWLLALLFAVYPLFVGSRNALRRRQRVPGACDRCGYDLTSNVTGRCPECGTAIERRAGEREGIPASHGCEKGFSHHRGEDSRISGHKSD